MKSWLWWINFNGVNDCFWDWVWYFVFHTECDISSFKLWNYRHYTSHCRKRMPQSNTLTWSYAFLSLCNFLEQNFISLHIFKIFNTLEPQLSSNIQQSLDQVILLHLNIIVFDNKHFLSCLAKHFLDLMRFPWFVSRLNRFLGGWYFITVANSIQSISIKLCFKKNKTEQKILKLFSLHNHPKQKPGFTVPLKPLVLPSHKAYFAVEADQWLWSKQGMIVALA